MRPGEKLYCLSYSPFRGRQTPLDANTQISAAQIEDDLSRLAQLTDCVRTYSIDYGQDQIAGIAARHGLKVMQGMWLSSHPDKNQVQIETAVALANKYPGTIRALVVGNEVLLRGEMSATELAATIRAVKARVSVPVTYADVWEFWLRNRDVAAAVDFVTIHILPYWEDFPIPARNAAAHVESIRRQLVQAFAGKEVIIGEVGWPSAGRMREGALPSPANQARVIQDVLALGKRENFRVNVIEAFDEPWKRALEGTVGGHWGLLDDSTRTAEIRMGRGGVQSSAVALAGGGRNFIRVASVRRGLRRPARCAGAARALAGGDGECDRGRLADRLEPRQCADRILGAKRLVALAGVRWRGIAGAAELKRGCHARHAAAALLAPARSRRRPQPRSVRACRGRDPDRNHAARDVVPRSAWYSIRATAIFHSRR